MAVAESHPSTETAPGHSDQVLIFLHLPKCGGTTLNRIIEWEYNPLRIFSVDPSFFKWSYRKLGKWSTDRLAKMDVFKGHMPFGLHERLPRPSTYITFLREPIERSISAYYFAKTYVLHPLHWKVKRMTLDEYVQWTPNHNVQTKLLAGQDFAADCTEDTLALAKANLANHFTLAGLTERFDECLALLKIMFGWNIAQYANFNETGNRPKKGRVPQSSQDLIAERNRFDVALYAHVVPLFDEVVKRYGEEAQVQLQAIRQAKSLGIAESAYYLTSSAIRKGISRLNSAV
jgi:hypothetical protein